MDRTTDGRQQSVFLFLTEQCNLSCAHCYVSAGPALTNQMSDRVFAESLDLFVDRLGVRDVRLTGGEPTLHPRFDWIAASLKSNGCKVRIITNGIRLNRATGRSDFLRNVDECWVSLYGTTQERHAAIAGSGSLLLSTAVTLVASVAQTGYPIGASLLLSPGDRSLIQGTLERYLASGIRRVRLIPVQPDGRATRSTWSWVDWINEIKMICADLSSFARRHEFEVLKINNPFDWTASERDGCRSCLLAKRALWSVAPNGDTYSCCFNVYDSSHRIGNVADIKISDVLDTFTAPCRGLSAEFWRSGSDFGATPTCPISSTDLIQDINTT
jgi:molybdenum cofactor biosynthesis enzyme MoaA